MRSFVHFATFKYQNDVLILSNIHIEEEKNMAAKKRKAASRRSSSRRTTKRRTTARRSTAKRRRR